jgi:hypothetical protein
MSVVWLRQSVSVSLILYVASRIEVNSLQSLLNLNSVNQLISVMMKCVVLFEVRTEFLNNN